MVVLRRKISGEIIVVNSEFCDFIKQGSGLALNIGFVIEINPDPRLRKQRGRRRLVQNDDLAVEMSLEHDHAPVP